MKTPRLAIADTDGDGLTYGVVTIYAHRDAGEPVVVYSHFAGPQDSQPGTSAAQFDLQQTMNYLSANPQEIIQMDIPPQVEVARRAKLIEAVKSLAGIGIRYTVIDVIDHAPHEHWQQLRKAGANLFLTHSGYANKLLIASVFGSGGKFYDEWAKLGSLFDMAVHEIPGGASREQVLRIIDVDSAFKFAMPKHEEIARYVPRYGSTGAIAYYITSKNWDVPEFLRFAEELYHKLPPQFKTPEPKDVKYRDAGYGILADFNENANVIPRGLIWKTAAKLYLANDALYTIIYNTPPPPQRQGVGLIVASNPLRADEASKKAVDEAVREVASRYGVVVVGHSGALSAIFPPGSNVADIANEIATTIERKLTTPKVTHLVNDQLVAETLAKDYQKLHESLRRIEAKFGEIERLVQEVEKLRSDVFERVSAPTVALEKGAKGPKLGV